MLESQFGLASVHTIRTKTFNNWDSLMVTHSTTGQSTQGFTAVSEREPVFSLLYGRMRGKAAAVQYVKVGVVSICA